MFTFYIFGTSGALNQGHGVDQHLKNPLLGYLDGFASFKCQSQLREDIGLLYLRHRMDAIKAEPETGHQCLRLLDFHSRIPKNAFACERLRKVRACLVAV
jgi:hypothetical protein